MNVIGYEDDIVLLSNLIESLKTIKTFKERINDLNIFMNESKSKFMIINNGYKKPDIQNI